MARHYWEELQKIQRDAEPMSPETWNRRHLQTTPPVNPPAHVIPATPLQESAEVLLGNKATMPSQPIRREPQIPLITPRTGEFVQCFAGHFISPKYIYRDRGHICRAGTMTGNICLKCQYTIIQKDRVCFRCGQVLTKTEEEEILRELRNIRAR